MKRDLFEGTVLQPRDIALLRNLFESRVMTATHAVALHFDGKKEAAKKRLHRLKSVGLLSERARRAYEPSVLFLTRKAFSLLSNEGVLAEYPRLSMPSLEKRARVGNQTIRHELEVMDVKAAFHSALKADHHRSFSIAEFSTWPLLYEFKASRSGYGRSEILVKPDGFIRIHEREQDAGLSEHTFFLEVDRSTETQDTLVTRAGCYLNYYKSGDFAVRNGAERSAYKDFPFRVLIVCKTAERRNNTAERLLQHNPPIFTQVCLSTLAEVMTDPLGAIWIQPAGYRAAIEGTPFDGNGKREPWGYRRQTEREILVETKIKRLSLFG